MPPMTASEASSHMLHAMWDSAKQGSKTMATQQELERWERVARHEEAERHKAWSRRVRSEIEPRMNYLQLDAKTEEENRDIRRLWDLMNDICGKHERKAARNAAAAQS